MEHDGGGGVGDGNRADNAEAVASSDKGEQEDDDEEDGIDTAMLRRHRALLRPDDIFDAHDFHTENQVMRDLCGRMTHIQKREVTQLSRSQLDMLFRTATPTALPTLFGPFRAPCSQSFREWTTHRLSSRDLSMGSVVWQSEMIYPSPDSPQFSGTDKTRLFYWIESFSPCLDSSSSSSSSSSCSSSSSSIPGEPTPAFGNTQRDFLSHCFRKTGADGQTMGIPVDHLAYPLMSIDAFHALLRTIPPRLASAKKTIPSTSTAVYHIPHGLYDLTFVMLVDELPFMLKDRVVDGPLAVLKKIEICGVLVLLNNDEVRVFYNPKFPRLHSLASSSSSASSSPSPPSGPMASASDATLPSNAIADARRARARLLKHMAPAAKAPTATAVDPCSSSSSSSSSSSFAVSSSAIAPSTTPSPNLLPPASSWSWMNEFFDLLSGARHIYTWDSEFSYPLIRLQIGHEGILHRWIHKTRDPKIDMTGIARRMAGADKRGANFLPLNTVLKDNFFVTSFGDDTENPSSDYIGIREATFPRYMKSRSYDKAHQSALLYLHTVARLCRAAWEHPLFLKVEMKSASVPTSLTRSSSSSSKTKTKTKAKPKTKKTSSGATGAQGRGIQFHSFFERVAADADSRTATTTTATDVPVFGATAAVADPTPSVPDIELRQDADGDPDTEDDAEREKRRKAAEEDEEYEKRLGSTPISLSEEESKKRKQAYAQERQDAPFRWVAVVVPWQGK